jgi:hypothetical protein
MITRDVADSVPDGRGLGLRNSRLVLADHGLAL